jgi:hypothetical protein
MEEAWGSPLAPETCPARRLGAVWPQCCCSKCWHSLVTFLHNWPPKWRVRTLQRILPQHSTCEQVSVRHTLMPPFTGLGRRWRPPRSLPVAPLSKQPVEQWGLLLAWCTYAWSACVLIRDIRGSRKLAKSTSIAIETIAVIKSPRNHKNMPLRDRLRPCSIHMRKSNVVVVVIAVCAGWSGTPDWVGATIASNIENDTTQSAQLHGARHIQPPCPNPPCSEIRTTCGGNYGWFDNKEQGVPCAPPRWDAVWPLNLSTTPATPWGPEISLSERGCVLPT